MDFYIYLQKTIFPSILFLLIPLQLWVTFLPPPLLICQSRGRKNLEKKKKVSPPSGSSETTHPGGGFSGNANTLATAGRPPFT